MLVGKFRPNVCFDWLADEMKHFWVAVFVQKLQDRETISPVLNGHSEQAFIVNKRTEWTRCFPPNETSPSSMFQAAVIILFSSQMSASIRGWLLKRYVPPTFLFIYLFYYIVINEEFGGKGAPAYSFLRHCKVLIVLLRAIFDFL